MIIKKKLLI